MSRVLWWPPQNAVGTQTGRLCSGGGPEQQQEEDEGTRFPGREAEGILRQRQCKKNRHGSYFLTFITPHKRWEIFHLNLVFKHFFPLKSEPTWLCFKSLPPMSYTIPLLGWLAHQVTMSTIQIHNMWDCAQACGQGLGGPSPWSRVGWDQTWKKQQAAT